VYTSERRRFAASGARRLLSLPVSTFLVLALATGAFAGLSGTLPGTAFTFTSTTVNAVNIDGNGIHLKAKEPISVKTTYSIVSPTGALLGWHYHNGPVIVTVSVGTITYVDRACHTWDVSAGQSYIESTGEILNAFLDPAKNSGNVEWFSTRLYPIGSGDPVGVVAPCSP
jgi:hypothetical protein